MKNRRARLACILVFAGAGIPACASQKDSGNTGTLTAGLVEPGSPGASDVTFHIRTDTSVRPISPYIYGVNETNSWDVQHYTIVRSGGNRWTAYNWVNNASNAGSDWCFQNDGFLSASNTPGDAITARVNAASANGAASLVTIPIVDYVAADKNGGCSTNNPCNPACDVRSSGSNYLTTRFRANRPVKGGAFSLTPSGSTVYQDEFVNWAKTKFPNGNLFFALDNEPDLWSDTHAPIHPNKVGYDELCQRNIDYARAIKSVWPDRQVTGYVSYGWSGYVTLQDAPDAAGKGEFIDYYLQRMRDAGTQSGKRLLDLLDLHWYPEATGPSGRIIGAGTSEADIEARIQAPRSLWDANYTEQSWIAQWATQGPIRLIPRIKAKIDANYPGTGLAFTEWTYGAGHHISGAIASADALGIYGREGVVMAMNWPINGDEGYTRAAMQMYRNYDGQGGHFGDTSVSAIASDVAASSVYASTDAGNPSRVVIVAINKRPTALTAGITVAGPANYANAAVYTLTSSSRTPTAAPMLSPVATNAFRYTMPARSVSIIVPTGTVVPQPDAGTPPDGGNPPDASNPPDAAQSNPTFTSTATASPSPTAPGSPVSITANIRATGGALANAVVDVEVYNSAGAKVSQQFYSGQSFAAGETKPYSFSWTPPAVGTYAVKAGVFGNGWTPNYHWNDAAGTFAVAASQPQAPFDFETGTQGFQSASSAVTLSSSTTRAFSGTRSLAASIRATASLTAQVYAPSVNVPAGRTVTFRLWVPAGAKLSWVQPYVSDANWRWTGTWRAANTLTGGAWNTITVAVPTNATTPMQQVGLQFATSGSSTFVLYLDAISW